MTSQCLEPTVLPYHLGSGLNFQWAKMDCCGPPEGNIGFGSSVVVVGHYHLLMLLGIACLSSCGLNVHPKHVSKYNY